jgi:choline dehydrogenase-like flavoprotein
VIGSGAGGGLIAGELAQRGRGVLLLEVGEHRSAADFVRWEAKANRDLWWPITQAVPATPEGQAVTLFRGRCVGGGTTINTKVGLRPPRRGLCEVVRGERPARRRRRAFR